MDFLLFILVNFTLFVRPSELVPELSTIPLYNIFMLSALVAAGPRISDQLDTRRLSQQPITVCVLGFWIAIMLSHLCRLDLFYTRIYGIDFFKVVLYYMLMTTVLCTHARIRSFLYWIAFFTAFNASVAMAHYYGYISIPSLRVLEYSEMTDAESGQAIFFRRMQGTGIFGDPNDLSMIAVIGMIISVYGVGDRLLGGRRFLWLLPASALLATVGLTKSRGGVLALGAAIVIVTYFRYGVFPATMLGGIFAPLSAVFTAGRGSAMEGGTGDQRMMFWAEGLTYMKTSPVFGVGVGNFQEEIRHVAHNSYVQAYVETGMFGGTMFFGAFFFAVLGMWNLRKSLKSMSAILPDRSIERMLPYILSIVFGACISMMSLTRCYIVPTFMLLGLVNAYLVDAQRQGLPAPVECSVRRLCVSLPIASIAFFYFIKLSIKLNFSV